MRTAFSTVLGVISLMVVLPAQAERWLCDYDGQWSTLNSSDKGRFTWSVVWESNAKGGWDINGAYTDEYGKSLLSGNCNNRYCTMTQLYHSGELKGKEYFWKGNYSDQARGDGETINRFEGTWGSSSSANEGLWRAVANCVRK